jgi:hypothetical protein
MQEYGENFRFEQGTDPNVLLILFTGFGKRPSSQPFDFHQIAGLYPYSRIFVRDPSGRMCLHGIGGWLNSLEKLMDALRETAQRAKATRIITVGSSGGSYPAILAAHLLKADYCHAFSAFPYANLERAILRMDWQIIRAFWRTVLKLNFLPTRSRQYYDLRKVLLSTNNCTRYYLHVCRHYPWDYKRSKYLAGLPNVSLLSYPCDQHVVIRHLVKQHCADKLFDIKNQDRLLELEEFRHAVESD